MDFYLTMSEEEEKFRQELSEFLDQELTYEICRQHAMDKGLGVEARQFARKLGEKGWLGLGWPKEYGGSGGGLNYEIILVQEMARHGARVPNEVARFMAGPVILHHGSEEVKQEFLPRIAKGEIEFGLGYTEPNAGSDLMAMQMSAEDHGDYFIINGQKTFNTESHYADYHWLAAKTDPKGLRHQSISLFAVDQQAPGITITPIETLGGERSNEVFYDKVKVPRHRLIGNKNEGFSYMIQALNYERLMLLQTEHLFPTMHRLIAYLKKTSCNGVLLSEDPLVRDRLARMRTEAEAAQCLEYRALAMLINGQRLDWQSNLVKLFSSEARQRFASMGMEILGHAGLIEEIDPLAVSHGEFARLARCCIVDTIGGGTSEIIRNLTATRGLGLPR